MKKRTLSDLGELELVRRLCAGLPSRSDVAASSGDDCAVVRAPGGYDLLLKSDPVIEGIHFRPGTRGAAIGHKALGRVLSDIAAMGGEPLWALVDLVAPPETSVSRVKAIFRSLSALARKHRMAVVGGDTSRGPELEVHVFGVGRVPRGRAVLRSGAKPGDSLYVTGALGGSLAGKHLKFEPRLRAGRWLGAAGWARAMIDVSDGLATDLRHLVQQSRVGAVLDLSAIPVSAMARRLRGEKSPLEHALTDGEDFELLFAVTAGRTAAFTRAWRRTFRLSCVRIGTVTARRGVIEGIDAHGKRTRLRTSGYDHFKK